MQDQASDTGRSGRGLGLCGRLALTFGLAGLILCLHIRDTQDAIANGDTRSISITHMHTKESLTITFKRDGRYDGAALEKLNWLLRDWRSNEPIKMDPRLFDVAWEVHREIGSGQPFHVVSAYRSPNTNSMLRRRSRAVAKHSQHTLGKAMDFYLPDVSPARIRAIGVRLQRGGVGYYPSAHTPFIHLDVGSVRSWPRLTRDQLARIFPDGRTVHIPADGKPMPGYNTARAEILSRGGSVAGFASADLDEGAIMQGSRRSLWASLFGWNEEKEAEPRRGRAGTRQSASRATAYAPAPEQMDDRYAAFTAPVISQPAPATAPATAPAPAVRTQVAALPSAALSADRAEPAVPSRAPAGPRLVAAPLPLARPTGLANISPAPEQTAPVAVAAVVPDARGSRLNWQVGAQAAGTSTAVANVTTVMAPLPPARPLATADATATRAGTANADPTGTGTPPPDAPATSRLVVVTHPAPPARPFPRLASLATSATGPGTPGQQPRTNTAPDRLKAMAPVPPPDPAAPLAPATTAASPSARDRAALDLLFARVAQPSTATGSATAVRTARARVVNAPTRSIGADAPAAAFGFSRTTPQDIPANRFTGPAVRPLPTTFVGR